MGRRGWGVDGVQRLTIEACMRLRILVLICLFVLFVIIIVAHLLVLVVITLSSNHCRGAVRECIFVRLFT